MASLLGYEEKGPRIAFIICVLFAVYVFFWIKKRNKKRRQQELLKKELSKEHLDILERFMPVYKKLSQTNQRELQGHVNVFLDEKEFEGFEGLEINDEIRVLIAAQACLLLLNRETDLYEKLHSVYVYPSLYVAKVQDKDEVRAGESWGSGTVVLAWDHAKRGAKFFKDGKNVVLHEFAHQLDQADGAADGAPLLEHSSQYLEWSKVLGDVYKVLQKKSRFKGSTFLDKYGATNPAEFFAVATEFFYEKPKKFKKRHPELYEALMDYYKVDPSEWT
jgi:Mlc titration factor MtfA (ptsG expression regulator)